jgi:hypothetical protein
VEKVYGLYVSSCPAILDGAVLMVRYVSSGGG